MFKEIGMTDGNNIFGLYEVDAGKSVHNAIYRALEEGLYVPNVGRALNLGLNLENELVATGSILLLNNDMGFFYHSGLAPEFSDDYMDMFAKGVYENNDNSTLNTFRMNQKNNNSVPRFDFNGMVLEDMTDLALNSLASCIYGKEDKSIERVGKVNTRDLGIFFDTKSYVDDLNSTPEYLYMVGLANNKPVVIDTSETGFKLYVEKVVF